MPRVLGAVRNIGSFAANPTPTTIPQQITYFAPPSGMTTQLRPNQLPRTAAALIENMRIRDMHLITRDGTNVIGDLSSTNLVYATQVELSSGRKFTLRWRLDGVDYLKTGTWAPCNGVPVSAGKTTTLAITGWNDTVVFGTQIGTLYTIDFSSGVPTISVLSVDAPANTIHLATFAGRNIASVRGTRIQWCVKNDNTQWVDTPTLFGSGFEDLISAPGGVVDRQTAVIPVTDELAYVIRTNSVWQMTLTGNSDAPFNFSRLYSGVGAPFPGGVCEVSDGVCFMSRDNVVYISQSGGKVNIGEPVREALRVDARYLRDVSMAYDVRNDCLRLSIPDANSLGASKVYLYDFKSQGWTLDVYPFPIKAMSFTRYAASVRIGDLVGTIAQQVGTIGDLGSSDKTVGFIYTMNGDPRRVVRDDSSQNNNAERDVNSNGTTVVSGFRIETGYIVKDRTIERITILEMAIEYEADEDTALVFEYSDNAGFTWTQYSAVTALATTGPRVLSVRQSLDRENIRLALSTEASPNFRLIAWHVWATNAGLVEDAR